MTQLRVLIRRELLDNLTSSRYVLTSVLCVALCVTSIVLMLEDYTYRQKRFNLSHNVSGMHHNLSHRQIFAKPPQPLSVMVRGIDEVIGRTLHIAGAQPEEEPVAHVFNYYGEEHHLFDLFTIPDFVYIISIVLSALTIFLSFDVICREKETHTLSLVLSHSLPRSMLLFAKWIGGYTSLLVSLLPALVLMLLFLTASARAPLEAEHWIRLLVIIGFSFIYLSVFFTLGLLISTLTHRSSTALILVLFIWVIWVLGMPRAGTLAAKVIKPIQPAFSFGMEKRAAKQGTVKEDQENLWKMDDAYIAKVDGQIELGQHLSRLSPLTSYVYTCTTLAQTGIPDGIDYRQAVSQWDRERRRGHPTEFVHQTITLEQSLSEIFMDGVLLVLWNVLLFMGAIMVFSRYDVR